MSGVGGFFLQAWNTVRSILGMVVPLLKKPADFRHWPRWVSVVVHLLVIGAVYAGLWYFSERFNVGEEKIKGGGNSWLPNLVLCLYFLAWLLYWLIQTFLEDDAEVEFPDIDAAWTAAVAQLADADIQLGDLPVFLILGKTAAGEEALFKAAGLKDYYAVPGGPQAPVRVYAHRDALYVVCAGASGWGRYCGYLSGEAVPVDVGDPDNQRKKAMETLDPLKAAQIAEGPDKALQAEMNQLISLSQQRDRVFTPEEKARLQELSDLYRPKAAAKTREPIPKKVIVTDQARFNFLCKLIKRDRRPWCPVNGALVLIPWNSLESEATNREGHPILNQELSLLRDTLDLRAPVLAMVCDLEGAVGFTEFRSCFQAEAVARQRVGQRVPLVPDVPAGELPVIYETVAQWIGQNVLPKWVLQFLSVDQSADLRRTPGVASPHNAKLYLLLREMYQRSPRLGRTLAKGVVFTEAGEKEPLPLFGGCYLAATGKTEGEMAFAAGVFSRLVENQNFVSWTPQAYDRQGYYGRMTLIFTVLSLGLLGLIGWMLWGIVVGK